MFMQPPMACGILFLVFHVMHKKTNLLAQKIKADEVDDKDDEVEHYEDAKLEKETENVEIKEEDISPTDTSNNEEVIIYSLNITLKIKSSNI